MVEQNDTPLDYSLINLSACIIQSAHEFILSQNMILSFFEEEIVKTERVHRQAFLVFIQFEDLKFEEKLPHFWVA